jgi:GntR family transcriptional regulator / MocR family aminotransferase
LGVSRHTVTTAYGHLAAEGFLDGRRRGGTVVSDLVALREPYTWSGPVLDLPPAGFTEEILFDLRPGTPDPRLFPITEWKRHARWAVDHHEAGYGDPAGITDLRLVLARWIAKSRGVDASFRQLMVTSGAQQAFFLLIAARTLPGDTVAVEDPGYHRFRNVVEAHGARVAPVPVDEDGIVVEAIPPEAKVVYVTPSHQFPTGVTMSMSRRLALLKLARDQDTLIIEDDYDSEFRYVDRPLEPLYRLDRSGRVAYVASFSKTLSPALRLGYVVVPPELLSDILDLREQVDWAPSQVDQLTLKGYLAVGEFERYLRKTRRIYQQRHSLVTDFLRVEATRHSLQPVASNAGLHVATHLNAGAETVLCRALADRGVAVEGLSTYFAGPTATGGLLFGFGQTNADQLQEALEIVGDVLNRV